MVDDPDKKAPWLMFNIIIIPESELCEASI